MRIVHVSDTFAPLLGGIEVQVARLVARQHMAGHRVEVITTTPVAPGDHGVASNIERLGGSGGGADTRPAVTVHRIAARVPGGWPIHPRSTTHVVRRLRELMASGARPDVVHLHLGVLAPTVQAALRSVTRLGLPAVLTVHSVWGPTWRMFAAADAVAGWSRWPVLWSAVSELTAAPLRRIVGADGEVVVLPNGLDLAAWRSGRPRETTAGELHVVSAARFAPRKRMLPFLEAVARAHGMFAGGGPGAGETRLGVPGVGGRRAGDPGAGDPPADGERAGVPRSGEPRRGRLRVTLAGDGAELGRARRFVAEHGLSDVVSLPGALGADGLRELYAGADVFVAPAVDEAFGIAALEAQAAGLPVLTRAGSGVAERVADGVDGLVVPDDAALARALVRLATDGDLLRGIRNGSHDGTRLAAYDWPGVLAETEKAYARAARLTGGGQDVA